jgi:hypothetical protein
MENSFVEKYHNHCRGDPPSGGYRLDSIYSIIIGRDVKCQPLLGCGLKFRKKVVRWGKRKKEAADEKGQSRRGMEKAE